MGQPFGWLDNRNDKDYASSMTASTGHDYRHDTPAVRTHWSYCLRPSAGQVAALVQGLHGGSLLVADLKIFNGGDYGFG